jgi:hypothetical protein
MNPDFTSPSKGGSRASSRGGSRRAGADSGLTSKNGISGFFLMATGQIESADVSYKTNEFISLRFSSKVDIVSFIS